MIIAIITIATIDHFMKTEKKYLDTKKRLRAEAEEFTKSLF